MNLSKHLCVDKELFSGTNMKDNTMNLSKHLCVDKELFSGTNMKENTMNLSKHLCVDKELFFGVYKGTTYSNTILKLNSHLMSFMKIKKKKQ